MSEFVGSINVLQAVVAEVTETETPGLLVTLRRGAHWIRCHTRADAGLQLGQQVLVSIRPEKLSLRDARTVDPGLNVWAGRIATAAYYGDHREYDVQVDDQLVRVTTPAATIVERGDEVAVACDPSDVVVMAQ